MKAIYVRYLSESHGGKPTGTITNFEIKTKGFCPKVADYHRLRHESVVRFSIQTKDNFNLGRLFGCKIDKNRNAVDNQGRVILGEDKEKSLFDSERIQED